MIPCPQLQQPRIFSEVKKMVNVRVVGLLVSVGGHQRKGNRGIEGIGEDRDEEEGMVLQDIP